MSGSIRCCGRYCAPQLSQLIGQCRGIGDKHA
jgi:hypothetical protein